MRPVGQNLLNSAHLDFENEKNIQTNTKYEILSNVLLSMKTKGKKLDIIFCWAKLQIIVLIKKHN